MAKVGDKIRILNMQGEPEYAGKEGVIKHIDAIGQIHGTWGGCAVIPATDSYVVLSENILSDMGDDDLEWWQK